MNNRHNLGIAAALAAALLFGASTPLVKLVAVGVGANAAAALLYLGSGLGLLVVLALKRLRGHSPVPIPQNARWRFALAIVAGGVVAPVLLLLGLHTTAASTTSLLLNLEGVLTAAIAWVVFKENVDRRVFFGMGAIVAGGVIISVGDGLTFEPGALFVVGACACWAIDNNLTQAASSADPLLVAGCKGLIAGLVNLAIAWSWQQPLPLGGKGALLMAVGLGGYGVSLALFVLGLRHLGTARTGAYFGAAPFVGAALSVLVLAEPLSPRLLVAGGLMGLGLWLHLSERHEHEHQHDELEHEHQHEHDEHHPHQHSEQGAGPHAHLHRHAPLRHSHPHVPDLHHRHDH